MDTATETSFTWAKPPLRVAPARHHVDLWLAELDCGNDLESRLAADLTAEERARAERLRFADDRRRFVARRAWLRGVLAGYLGTTPSDLLIDASPRGKPFVKRPAVPRVSFSFSHSAGWALVGVTAGCDVGVDLESLSRCPVPERLPTHWVTDAEQRNLAALPPHLRTSAFLSSWTSAEALSKATGLGLSRCALRLPRCDQEHPSNIAFAGRSWRTIQFVPKPGIFATLVVER